MYFSMPGTFLNAAPGTALHDIPGTGTGIISIHGYGTAFHALPGTGTGLLTWYLPQLYTRF